MEAIREGVEDYDSYNGSDVAGSMRDIRRESLRAILAGGGKGGFVLSPGDQCGRDTPIENILEMVRVAREFGAYPMDRDLLAEELRRLRIE